MQAIAIRQGDVMLRSASIPAAATRIQLRPLALGEKTGHHHSLAVLDRPTLEDGIDVEMYEHEGKTFVRTLRAGVALTHQEHKTHALPARDYEVILQQENTDFGQQPVQD